MQSFYPDPSFYFFQLLRTDEMFDIVIDYPDSTPALHDLKVGLLSASTLPAHSLTPWRVQECLQRVDQRSQLVQALRKA
jgi:anaphase-promoting complex subunit 2